MRKIAHSRTGLRIYIRRRDKMATLFPTLERENTQEKFEQESSLKAYGKLSGRDESAALTEDEKAMRFNSQISDNYQKLINPEYKREEEVVAESAAEAPVFEPIFEHQRVTEDLFRADSVYNAPKRSFAEIPAASYAEPVYAPETYAEPEQNTYAPEQQAFGSRSQAYRHYNSISEQSLQRGTAGTRRKQKVLFHDRERQSFDARLFVGSHGHPRAHHHQHERVEDVGQRRGSQARSAQRRDDRVRAGTGKDRRTHFR